MSKLIRPDSKLLEDGSKQLLVGFGLTCYLIRKVNIYLQLLVVRQTFNCHSFLFSAVFVLVVRSLCIICTCRYYLMARCKLVKSKKQKIESEGYFRGIKICKKNLDNN